MNVRIINFTTGGTKQIIFQMKFRKCIFFLVQGTGAFGQIQNFICKLNTTHKSVKTFNFLLSE